MKDGASVSDQVVEGPGLRVRLDQLSQQMRVFVEPGHRRGWLGLVALAVVVAAMEVASALLIFLLVRLLADPGSTLDLPVLGDLRQRFPSLDDDQLLILVVSAVCGFFLIRGGVVLLQSYVRGRIAERTGARLAGRLFRGYLEMPYERYLQRHSAELIRNVNDSVSDVVHHTLIPSVRLASELFVVMALTFTLVIAAPLGAAIGVALFGPMMWLLFRQIQPRIALLGEQDHEHARSALRALQQSLHGFRDIKVYGREAWFHHRFLQIRNAIAKIRAVRWFFGDIPRVALETSLVLFVALFVGASTVLGREPGESVPVLGIFGYAALRILPSLNHVVLEINDLRYGAAAASEVYRDLSQIELIATERGSVDGDGGSLRPMENSIELRNVSYRYPAAVKDALQQVNLRIERGELIGIVGQTGGGKSTLLDVIVGLLPPRTGAVLVDGRDIRSDIRGWQRQLGTVPQSVYLLDDTLRHNIALGEDDASIDEAVMSEAVRIAQLETLVESLPAGLDSTVGEHGSRLSGGERQRVAIARALYRRPSVLVLDEGTSALDTVTEAALVSAFSANERRRTVIIVAHRLTSVRHCDRLYVVDAGRIVDAGSFEELEDRSDVFKTLVRAAPVGPRGADA